ncbi:hypothetical protein EHP00_2241 [Ecytonucleospora hepatopenaei]|uniref:Uncharacterized protein n=1 Tax=Ecytonucleospora hepatopenaei TaxID=646526 RepID=A0A1W0E4H1_9MICR|nr:hypothetical protein EHP00_2241 [Ecytonucleospora hepatopenaei]
MSNNDNVLHKIFNTIKYSDNIEMKEYATNHLISILPQYNTYILYILTNTYELLMSENIENRKNGGIILKNIKYIEYKIVNNTNNILNNNISNNTNNILNNNISNNTISNNILNYIFNNNIIYLSTKDYKVNNNISKR